jgi:DNA (cytosine-5)-methyltransferase 1
VPNLGDITRLDWAAVPAVDVLTAGFPCQDISHAGRRAGITGARSGLWRHIAAAVRGLRHQFVFVENVAALCARGLDTVLTDLATLRYDATWLCLRASALGAAHHRDRLFILATPTHGDPGDAADPVRP